MNYTESILSKYRKALKVVESSTTRVHLEGANRYNTLFIKSNSKVDKKGNLITSDIVSNMYEELNRQLLIKENEIARKTN